MKVMNIWKNMMIQGSQQWMESRYRTMPTDYESIYDQQYQSEMDLHKQIGDFQVQSNNSTISHRKILIRRLIQHSMESRLIEGMNLKMQMIQFVLIVNLIQID
jgi:hypothetical protein